MTDRALLRIIALALLTVLPTSCVNLSKKAPDIRLYTLDAAPAPAPASGKAVVGIGAFTASPPCADPHFLLRQAGSQVELDFFNRFVVPPAQLVEDQAAAWFRSSGAFREVRTGLDAGSAPWLVTAHISRLEGDFSGKEPLAVITLQVLLTPGANQKGERFFKTYEQRIPLASSSPAALSDGWNKGLAAILAECASDVSAQM